MKAILFIFFACLALGFTQSSTSKLNCKDFHQGKFRLNDLEGNTGITIITRKGNTQIEENEKYNVKLSFKIKWVSSCKYELHNMKVLRGDLESNKKHIIYSDIIGIDKNISTVAVTSNFDKSKFQVSIEKIE